MKTMTCRQLGGACDREFHANTFEEMAEMSKKHGMEMAEKADEQHLKVMEEMKKLMNDPKAMQEWIERKQDEFGALPEDQ
jgi:hypothetical protein